MVECLISMTTFPSWTLEDRSAWDMRESIIGGYPYSDVTAVVTSERLPRGSHAAHVSSSQLSVITSLSLLLLGFWFWSTDADLNSWGVKWAVCVFFLLNLFSVHGAIMMTRATLTSSGMHQAVCRFPWGLDRAVRAAVGPWGVKGTVCCDVWCIVVNRAFSEALLSCRGVNRAVSGSWGMNRALSDGFNFSFGRAIGGVCLLWTLVQRGGAAETCS